MPRCSRRWWRRWSGSSGRLRKSTQALRELPGCQHRPRRMEAAGGDLAAVRAPHRLPPTQQGAIASAARPASRGTRAGPTASPAGERGARPAGTPRARGIAMPAGRRRGCTSSARPAGRAGARWTLAGGVRRHEGPDGRIRRTSQRQSHGRSVSNACRNLRSVFASTPLTPGTLFSCGRQCRAPAAAAVGAPPESG